jgi:DNA mismatch endonuclease (patch repair protein)
MKHQKLLTTPEVSKRMANVHLKEGKAETLLAKALWKAGFRYRKNYKKLPGSPDIAILKYRIAVFVDGEFWHGKDWENKKERLKTNRAYWIEKIEENMQRDKRNDERLFALGWLPIHFWEKDVKHDLGKCVEEVLYTLKNGERTVNNDDK